MKHSLVARFLVLILMSGAFCNTASAVPQYTLTELGSSFAREELRVSNSGIPYLLNLNGFHGFHAYDTNSSGFTVGTKGGSSNNYTAVLYEGDVFIRKIPFIAAYPAWSNAWAINENGDILGGSTRGTDTELQIFSATGNLSFVNASSYRRPSFNNKWDIVGADYMAPAFLLDSSGRHNLSDLVQNLSGYNIAAPTDISDDGYIVGYGRNSNGINTGFLLSPITPVPEPQPYALLLTAFGFFGLIMRRRIKSPTKMA